MKYDSDMFLKALMRCINAQTQSLHIFLLSISQHCQMFQSSIMTRLYVVAVKESEY